MSGAEAPTVVDPLDRWVSTQGLADFFGCSPRTIEGWRRKGEGPPGSRLPTGQWRYRLSLADAYLRKRQRGASSPD